MFRSAAILWAACAWLTVAAVAAEKPPQAILVDGAPFRGHLITAEPAWKLRFDVDGAPREIDAAELVTWGAFREPSGKTQIVLAGGGLVVADTVHIEEERLRGDSALVGKFDLPLKLAAGVVFHAPSDRAKLNALTARILSASGRDDRVLLANGDELVGTVAELSTETLQLQTAARKALILTAQLQALVFNPVLVDKPEVNGLRVVVGLADGSRMTAIALATETDSLQMKLPGGTELAVPVDAVAALQSLGGRAVYLSDLPLDPDAYRHIPFLQLSWGLGVDRSVLGGMLRYGETLYLKGLGMHSPSRVTYELDGPFRRFEAELAVDADTGDGGSVAFRVFTDDGSGTWREAAASDVVRGGEPSVPISVDLEGVERISLLVDFADRGDVLDHADWLNARLIR